MGEFYGMWLYLSKAVSTLHLTKMQIVVFLELVKRFKKSNKTNNKSRTFKNTELSSSLQTLISEILIEHHFYS